MSMKMVKGSVNSPGIRTTTVRKINFRQSDQNSSGSLDSDFTPQTQKHNSMVTPTVQRTMSKTLKYNRPKMTSVKLNKPSNYGDFSRTAVNAIEGAESPFGNLKATKNQSAPPKRCGNKMSNQ